MKTTVKEFDTVAFFRAEKERIAKDISTMSFKELKTYLKNKSKWIKKDNKEEESKV